MNGKMNGFFICDFFVAFRLVASFIGAFQLTLCHDYLFGPFGQRGLGALLRESARHIQSISSRVAAVDCTVPDEFQRETAKGLFIYRSHLLAVSVL